MRVLVPAAISPRPPAFGGVVHAIDGRAMGTSWSVRFVGPRQIALAPVRAVVQHELDDVVAQMSHWEAASDLGRFNRAAAGSWHALPQAFFDVLTYGLTLARDSAGAFDPTAGALVDAWGFGAGGRFAEPAFEPPTEAALAAARACSGWPRLEVQAAERRIRQPGGLRLDLSAIAKGHAVDRVGDALKARCGIESVLVEVGGELAGIGVKPDGQPWWVDLHTPPGGTTAPAPARVALHGLAIATSGDYLRCFEHRGERHPHTIDPRTGRPIRHCIASVTVIAARCMAADALATALTVLGPEEGPAWAARRGIAAQFVTRLPGERLTEQLTPAFAALAA